MRYTDSPAAATDKLTADMGHDLAPGRGTAVSLYPGLVRTEAVLAAGVFDLSNSESPEFVGRAVAALASDPTVERLNGKVVVAACHRVWFHGRGRPPAASTWR
jgi:hypothetical protein